MAVPARLAVALGLLAMASPDRYEPGGRAIAPPVERIVANAKCRRVSDADALSGVAAPTAAGLQVGSGCCGGS